MERVLLCVVVTSLAFSFLAARNHDRIDLRVAAFLAAAGVALLALAGVLGRIAGQPFEATYFALGPANDMAMLFSTACGARA